MKRKLTNNEDIRNLVVERLKILSPRTMISVGSEGDYTRDQMIKFVEEGNELGEMFAEIQIEWLRSFQKLVK